MNHALAELRKQLLEKEDDQLISIILKLITEMNELESRIAGLEQTVKRNME